LVWVVKCVGAGDRLPPRVDDLPGNRAAARQPDPQGDRRHRGARDGDMHDGGCVVLSGDFQTIFARIQTGYAKAPLAIGIEVGHRRVCPRFEYPHIRRRQRRAGMVFDDSAFDGVRECGTAGGHRE